MGWETARSGNIFVGEFPRAQPSAVERGGPMIIWGSGGKTVDMGVVENKRCETCEKERPFKLMLGYRYAHLYYIFSWVTKKQYMLLCDVCQRGWELKTAEIERSLAKNP